MARGRELSQLGSLITVDDSTKNIGVATATPSQKIGIGTLSPTSKVEVVGDVSVSGVITATTFSGDGSGLSNVPGTGGLSNVVEDTTPELGGDLDLNENDITGTGNINVTGVITATSYSGTSANFSNNVSVSGIITATTINLGSGGLQTVFPTDTDYGNLSSITTDAFGQQVSSVNTFDALSEPSKTLSTQDFGALT